MSEATGPLKGYRILDLTTVLFGPFGTQTLGDWGAEIIKIESLTGDPWRHSGQFRNRGMSGQFMAANRNKRSIALDLKHEDGKTVLERLIQNADALVSNIRPAGLDRLGFSYERCRELNIIITPPPTMPIDAMQEYAEVGVHRLVVNLGSQRPERVGPRLAEIGQLVRRAG